MALACSGEGVTSWTNGDASPKKRPRERSDSDVISRLKLDFPIREE